MSNRETPKSVSWAVAAGIACTVSVLSIYEDVLGVDAYIASLQNRWLTISGTTAIIFDVLLVMYTLVCILMCSYHIVEEQRRQDARLKDQKWRGPS